MNASDHQSLLSEARQKAAALLQGLLRDAADLQRNHSTLAAQAVTEGRAAHAAAVDAARRTIDNLDRSLEGSAKLPSGPQAPGANQD